MIGVSLVLDRPRATGLHRGYPWSAEGRRALARSPFRRLLNLSPAAVRRRVLAGISRELNAVAALAGPPTVAHAEALVRGASVRSVTVPRQLDTIVVPLHWEGLHLPREPLNPITAAALGLGHVLRLWRDRPPLAVGGAVVLLHPFSRVMGHGPQAPYRALFAALRDEAAAACEARRRSRRGTGGRLRRTGREAPRIRACPSPTGRPARRSSGLRDA